jgi:hypothetical protein
MFSAASAETSTEPQAEAAAGQSLITTSITASTVDAFLQEIQEATATGEAGRAAVLSSALQCTCCSGQRTVIIVAAT